MNIINGIVNGNKAYPLLLITIFIIRGVVWGEITSNFVFKRGYDENWYWWGFFFGLFAWAIAALSFKPNRELDKVRLLREYIQLFDEGFISQNEFDEAKQRLMTRKKSSRSANKRKRK